MQISFRRFHFGQTETDLTKHAASSGPSRDKWKSLLLHRNCNRNFHIRHFAGVSTAF